MGSGARVAARRVPFNLPHELAQMMIGARFVFLFYSFLILIFPFDWESGVWYLFFFISVSFLWAWVRMIRHTLDRW